MKGWLLDADGCADADDLQRWVAGGIGYARSLPPKQARNPLYASRPPVATSIVLLVNRPASKEFRLHPSGGVRRAIHEVGGHVTTASKTLGSQRVGGVLVRQADISFVNLFMKGGIRRKRLSIDEQFMYRRPHPTAESREPVQVMPREILAAEDLLSEVEQGLGRVADKPTLIVWGPKDPGFRERHRLRWERTFPNHRTEILPGAAHYIQEDAPDEIVAAIKDWWPGTRS
jgi:pimeloyl-ACP methyl ester carboxylesterase